MKIYALLALSLSSFIWAKESILIDLNIQVGSLRAKPKILTLLNNPAQISQRDEHGQGFDLDITPKNSEKPNEKAFDIIIKDAHDLSGKNSTKNTIIVKEHYPATLTTIDNATGKKQIIELKYATIVQ
ncbi:MAG: hypothetical protein KA116_13035 [Proteobacteria bacterium]|nr:hypothetical protein [Pseudomonadota bacterium]